MGDQQMAVGQLVVQVASSTPKINVLGLMNVSLSLIPQVSYLNRWVTRLRFIQSLNDTRLITFAIRPRLFRSSYLKSDDKFIDMIQQGSSNE